MGVELPEECASFVDDLLSSGKLASSIQKDTGSNETASTWILALVRRELEKERGSLSPADASAAPVPKPAPSLQSEEVNGDFEMELETEWAAMVEAGVGDDDKKEAWNEVKYKKRKQGAE